LGRRGFFPSSFLVQEQNRCQVHVSENLNLTFYGAVSEFYG
jgi:hypothetical protein